MTLVTLPLLEQNAGFAGEIRGADLGELTDELRRQFVDAMDRFAVCVIREANLTNERHIAFSRLLGEPEPKPAYAHNLAQARLPYRELFDISNLDQHGQILVETDRRRLFRLANEMWHTDSSYRAGGASYSLLAAYVVPSQGADTQFADMRAAYDELPETLKQRVEGLVAVHSIEYSRSLVGYTFDASEQAERPPVKQLLVQTNPRTGRKSLYLANYASHVVGMPVDEGRALLRELTDFATQDRFLYTHKWSPGDLLVWDNRCTMHRATPFDGLAQRRDLRRTTLFGDLPVLA